MGAGLHYRCLSLGWATRPEVDWWSKDTNRYVFFMRHCQHVSKHPQYTHMESWNQVDQYNHRHSTELETQLIFTNFCEAEILYHPFPIQLGIHFCKSTTSKSTPKPDRVFFPTRNSGRHWKALCFESIGNFMETSSQMKPAPSWTSLGRHPMISSMDYPLIVSK